MVIEAVDGDLVPDGAGAGGWPVAQRVELVVLRRGGGVRGQGAGGHSPGGQGAGGHGAAVLVVVLEDLTELLDGLVQGP